MAKTWTVDPKPDTAADMLKSLSPEAQAMVLSMQAMIDELRASRPDPMAQALAHAKIMDPSNKVGPNISVCNPRGEKDFPMPVLKCEIWAPWRSRPQDHGLDREEVELFNLLEPGEYRVELVDGTTQRVVVLGQRHALTNEWTRLTLSGPLNDEGKGTPLFTQENKGLFPSMRLILREILAQTDQADAAAAVMTMRQEVAKIASGELTVSQGA